MLTLVALMGPSARLRSLLRSPRTRLVGLGSLVAGGSAAALVFGGPGQGGVERTIADAGALAPLAFIGLYALLTVLCFPGAVLTAAAGAFFGVALGTLLAVIGATLGPGRSSSPGDWAATRSSRSPAAASTRSIAGSPAAGSWPCSTCASSRCCRSTRSTTPPE